ncbi:unnamed protein product [Rangifer tarandus platyrhynchus]|uniref:Basic proline-rich protein-like n=2 Tax=Rangifer tarandus platyrhynchus TaxID=3082113 RepID=A0ABN8YQ84_RANTA|nr:unnamed protein product [Rangifer tarandus platyrhynchus]CAI9701512.1 unnamed protein product [Rangifer tarandus platyrhynchus]
MLPSPTGPRGPRLTPARLPLSSLKPPGPAARSPPATWPPLVVPASHLVPRVGLTAHGQPPRSGSCLTSARSPSSSPRKRQPCARPSFACALPRGRRRRERAARPPPPPRPRPGRRSPVAGGAPTAAPGSAPAPGLSQRPRRGLLQGGLRGWDSEPLARVLSGTSNYPFLRACCWSPQAGRRLVPPFYPLQSALSRSGPVLPRLCVF